MLNEDDIYRKEVDYILREDITKLKGLIDQLQLGVLDSMDEAEQQAFFETLKHGVDDLYERLNSNIIGQQM